MAIEEVISVSAGGAVSEVNAVADAFESMAAKAAEAVAKINESLSSVGTGGGGAAAGADKLAASMDAAAARIAEAADKAAESLTKVGEAGDTAAGGVERLGGAADAAAGGLGDVSASADEAAAASSRLADSADAAGGALDRQAVAGERAGKAGAEGAASSGGFWTGLKTVMLGAGVAAAYGIDKAMKFQSQMLLLNTQAGVSIPAVKQMSQGALEISTQTGQSLSNVAESAYHVASNMASMGTSVPSMLNAVKIAAEGAAVGHSNMVDTTNALTATLAAGMPGVKTYGQAMGTLNATVGAGDMSMQDLADAMGTGMLATVKGFGVTIQDTGAGLATFGDNNIRGAKAGNEFRMAIQALGAPGTGPAAVAALNSLGLAHDTLAKDMQRGGLKLAVTDLSDRMKKAGDTGSKVGEVLTDAFGKKAGAGINILTEQEDRFLSKYPAMTQGANDFGAAWTKTQATPAQKLKELETGFTALAVNFGTTLLPAFTEVSGFVDGILAKLNSSKGAVADLAIGLGALGGLFAANKLVSGVESAFKTGETVLSGVGKVAQTLNIPGLSKLAGLGKGAAGASSADAASAGLDRMAGAADAAAAALDKLAGAAGSAAAGEDAAGAAGDKAAAGETAAGVAGGKAAAGETAAGTAGDTAAAGEDAAGAGGMKAAGGLGGLAAAINPLVAAFAIAATVKGIGDSLAPKGSKAGTVTSITQQSSLGGPSGADSIGGWFGLLATHMPALFGNSGPMFVPTPGPAQSFLPAPGHGWSAPAPASAAPLTGAALTSLLHPADVKAKITLDTSSVDAAKGKIAADMAGIGTQMSAGAAKPVKLPEPDLSALVEAKGKASADMTSIVSGMQAAAGPARAAGAAVSEGLAAGIAAAGAQAIAAAQHVASEVAAAMASALQTKSPSKVTTAIGADTSTGLAVGITSKAAAVKAAAATITASTVNSLVTGLQGGQTAVDAAMTALGQSTAKPQDIQSILSSAATLKTDLSKALTAGDITKSQDSSLVSFLNRDSTKLQALAAKRDMLEQEITSSQQIAQAQISEASIMNAPNAQPAGATQPQSSYSLIQGMQDQAAQQKSFAADVKKLKAEGLNATSLNQIISAGAGAGDPVAQGIAQDGKGAIKQINSLQSQITQSASQIGDTGGPAAFQAGQQVASQTALGLKSELGSVDGQMKAIGQAMVNAVKDAVSGNAVGAMKAAGASLGDGLVQGIRSEIGAVQQAASDLAAAAEQATKKKSESHSPSMVFWRIGYGYPSGLALGVNAGTPIAVNALTRLAQQAAASYGGPGAAGHPGMMSPYGTGQGLQGGGLGSGYGGGGLQGGGLVSGGGGTVHHHTHVTVNVQGSVMSENDLVTSVQNGLLKRGNNNWQTGIVPPGRAA